MPSALGPLWLPPLSTNTGNSANSFRQYPAPCSLPQIQGEQGGAEGQTEAGAAAAPIPWSSLLLPPAPSASGSNLRFPPALKIALTAHLPGSPGNKLPDQEFVRSLEGSRLGFPSHPPNSKLSSEEVGDPHGGSFHEFRGIQKLEILSPCSVAGH